MGLALARGVDLPSATMPTTVKIGGTVSQVYWFLGSTVICCPSGSEAGKNFFANESLMITTNGPLSVRSLQVKSRPLNRGRRIATKKCGDTGLKLTVRSAPCKRVLSANGRLVHADAYVAESGRAVR